jgi:hypothetical protein
MAACVLCTSTSMNRSMWYCCMLYVVCPTSKSFVGIRDLLDYGAAKWFPGHFKNYQCVITKYKTRVQVREVLLPTFGSILKGLQSSK